ncbi:MAG: hypothetical protein ACREGH_03860, partial [Minisyncoccia bacterium]
MSRLARKKALPKNRVVALIDIGSSSAAAALVEVGGDKPIVLAHKRVAMPIDGSRGAAGLEARMLTAAREAVRQVSRGRHAGKATSVAVFLPSPWSALTLDRIRFARAAPFVADEALVRRLMNVRLQREEHPGAGEAFGYTLSGMRLNGYAADFFGETPIMEIELTLGSARASRSLLERLGALARELSSAPADFYSSILAAAQALSLVITDENDYLICDSEGETAELLLVRDAIPEAHASIPAGRAGIVRTVALHGGFDTREISSALTLMADPRSPMSLSASGAIAAGRRACAERLGA